MPEFPANEFHPLRLTRFDLDVVDFLSSPDVASMSATEVGQYFLLLCAAWVGGKNATLPDDPKMLAKLARAPRGVSKRVLSKFPRTKTADHVVVRHNLRLTKEWESALVRAQRRHEKAQKAAKIGWEQRAHGMPGARSEQAPSTPTAMLGNAPDPVPVLEAKDTLAGKRSRTRTTKFPPQSDELFQKFWDDYPRKIRDRETWKAWRTLSEADRMQAVEVLAAFKASQGWQDEDGKFIPGPHRFLREGHWKKPPSKGGTNANGNRKQTNSVNSQRGTNFSARKTVLDL